MNLRPIVFFDGVCHLCNGFVDWVIQRDSQKVFCFASLQGETAMTKLPKNQRVELESIVIWLDQNHILEKSDAILYILSRIPRWSIYAQILKIFPRSFRDWVYKGIAENRYRIFGKRDICRLPTKEEREFLLP